ncbi:zinc-finger-containing protein [Sporosarcina psychrophila]|uniref:DNA-directed RNA polymerase subunit RPC12/RpoP n=1 Tax=Sporosarcina psychrophila TaxID=1476 RepID=A0ABV2K9Y3_SPOPS
MTIKTKEVICPYCDKSAVFTTSKEFYGKDFRTNLYVCLPCDARVGTHGRGRTPLGTLANGRLRNLRKMCHARIDSLWRGKRTSRRKVYARLQRAMSLSSEEAHIGMFDEEQCMKLITIFDKGEF